MKKIATTWKCDEMLGNVKSKREFTMLALLKTHF